jgi:hypothetical protein
MNTVNLSAPAPVSATTTASSAAKPATPLAAPSVQRPSGDTAAFSGHAILLSRLFHTQDLNAQPPVETIDTKQHMASNTYSFLTIQDRKLLERAYEYANANGMDPLQVDGVAFDLSFYRHMQHSGTTAEITDSYDSEGNPWVGNFNAHDTELAKRMLTSRVINDTDIDKGFLAYTLNPQRKQLHAFDFGSLEKLISTLSPSGGKSPPDNQATDPVQPADAGLAQALYRIDHPYEGEKRPPAKSPKADDQPLQHLSRHEIRQLLATYQMTLLQGTSADAQSLAHLTDLAGIAKGLQNDHLNGNIASHQDAIDYLHRLSEALSQSGAKADKSKTAQGLATYNKVSSGSTR